MCRGTYVSRWFALLDYNVTRDGRPCALSTTLLVVLPFRHTVWHTCSGLGLGLYGLRLPLCEGIGHPHDVVDVDLGVRACRTHHHAGASLPFVCFSFFSPPLLFCPFLPASPFVCLHGPWAGRTTRRAVTEVWYLPGVPGVSIGVHAWTYVFRTQERQLPQDRHRMHSHWVCLECECAHARMGVQGLCMRHAHTLLLVGCEHSRTSIELSCSGSACDSMHGCACRQRPLVYRCCGCTLTHCGAAGSAVVVLCCAVLRCHWAVLLRFLPVVN